MNILTKAFNIILFTTILLVFTHVAKCQVTEEWVQLYNGPGNDFDAASSIAVDLSGYIYVTGVSFSGVITNDDYCTIKYNSSGVQQWIERYNGPGNGYDNATSLAVDNSSNVYVTGNSLDSGTGQDYYTIKYNSSGVQQWAQRYNGPGNLEDYATSLRVDNSGNVYVTGYSKGTGTNYDYCTIKYNSSGVQQWVQRYNGPGNLEDYATSLSIDNLGNVYATGYSKGSGTNYDYCTIKYNSSGVQQWAERYNGPGNGDDRAYSIEVDNSGNVYVTGYSLGSGTGNDYCTIKYNSSGVEQWIKRYNGPGNGVDVARSITIDNTGNVYVAGYSLGSGTDYDCCAIKYNSSGVQQWAERYNGPGNGVDAAYSIEVDNLGDVYVAGDSEGSGTKSDYCIIKYNSSGVQQWIKRYNGPAGWYDFETSMVIDNSGHVYVTGYSGINVDYCTIKYYDPTGIQPISSEVPNFYELLQNYPNPFNPKTKIEFSVPEHSFVKIAVYDLMGRELEILVNESLKAGVYQVAWDASLFSSGIYFCKLITEGYSETKKMVLVK